jgi:hypothetical protein
VVSLTLADDERGNELGCNVGSNVGPNVADFAAVVMARDVLLLLANEAPNLIDFDGAEFEVCISSSRRVWQAWPTLTPGA